MKKFNSRTFYSIIFLIILFASCKKDSFLDRTPISDLTEQNFFTDANDLNTYCNGLYSFLPTAYIALNDEQSDNFEGTPYNKVVAGQAVVPTIAGQEDWETVAGPTGWSWAYLFQVNYFLQSYQKAVATAAIKNHYAGVARFFRAWFYFEKVKQYGDVPWYSTTIQPTDSAALMKPRDPRQLVMDSVIADLEFAAQNVNPTGPSGTITKWSALALLARVALHEGTFNEYRGVTGWQPLLQLADSAAMAVVQSTQFKLYSTGNPTQDYSNLFLTYDPSNPQSSEIILGAFYSTTLHATYPLDGYLTAYGHCLTKDLVNSYLMTNGTPFTALPGYDTMEINTEFTNRDPRLAQTVIGPAYTRLGVPYAPPLGAAPTGYQQIKYYDPATPGWNTNYNAALIFRYAEILLIHAEAKAESGTLTQSDLDMSVNALRDRVGMPHLSINAPVDPVLAAAYPNVAGSMQNIILEIRRERRVELACEGFRYDDLMRWKTGALLAKPFLGIYFPGPGSYDLNNDGTIDVVLVTTATTASNQKQIGVDIFLTNGNSGNVIVYPKLTKTFDENKNYYFPLPTTELLLNTNLKQNPGW
jgi:starch-binding outer membrane protein, SusD/RagB family